MSKPGERKGVGRAGISPTYGAGQIYAAGKQVGLTIKGKIPASWFALALAIDLLVAPAHADGGHVALRATSGSYTITLFTAPDPLVSGPADLSLLIQDHATGEVSADAAADGILTCPNAQPLSFSLTRDAASNKLLLAATPTLAGPGSCALVLRVARTGAAPALFTTVLAVARDHRRRTILLFGLVLPLAAILLFLVNQHAKFQRLRRQPALH